jgi:hypothetical protein
VSHNPSKEPAETQHRKDLVLHALAEALYTEKSRWLGVYSDEIWKRMPQSNDREELFQVSRALDGAEREGLLKHDDLDWDHIRLTPAGWRLVAGAMPGAEKDAMLLDALIHLWNDPNTRRWRGRVLGSTIYRHLNWPFDVAEVVNISRRLSEARLVDHLELSGDVSVRPTPQALEIGDQRQLTD